MDRAAIRADERAKVSLNAGLDHIANFINALDTEGMTALEVRKAIYKECITPTTGGGDGAD